MLTQMDSHSKIDLSKKWPICGNYRLTPCRTGTLFTVIFKLWNKWSLNVSMSKRGSVDGSPMSSLPGSPAGSRSPLADMRSLSITGNKKALESHPGTGASSPSRMSDSSLRGHRKSVEGGGGNTASEGGASIRGARSRRPSQDEIPIGRICLTGGARVEGSGAVRRAASRTSILQAGDGGRGNLARSSLSGGASSPVPTAPVPGRSLAPGAKYSKKVSPMWGHAPCRGWGGPMWGHVPCRG